MASGTINKPLDNDVTGLISRFPNFRQLIPASDTLAAFVNAINTTATADISIIDTGATVSSDLIGTTVTLGGISIVYKASSNNAYFFFFSRDKCLIGNVSLANVSVTVRHPIV